MKFKGYIIGEMPEVDRDGRRFKRTLKARVGRRQEMDVRVLRGADAETATQQHLAKAR